MRSYSENTAASFQQRGGLVDAIGSGAHNVSEGTTPASIFNRKGLMTSSSSRVSSMHHHAHHRGGGDADDDAGKEGGPPYLSLLFLPFGLRQLRGVLRHATSSASIFLSVLFFLLFVGINFYLVLGGGGKKHRQPAERRTQARRVGPMTKMGQQKERDPSQLPRSDVDPIDDDDGLAASSSIDSRTDGDMAIIAEVDASYVFTSSSLTFEHEQGHRQQEEEEHRVLLGGGQKKVKTGEKRLPHNQLTMALVCVPSAAVGDADAMGVIISPSPSSSLRKSVAFVDALCNPSVSTDGDAEGDTDTDGIDGAPYRHRHRSNRAVFVVMNPFPLPNGGRITLTAIEGLRPISSHHLSSSVALHAALKGSSSLSSPSFLSSRLSLRLYARHLMAVANGQLFSPPSSPSPSSSLTAAEGGVRGRLAAYALPPTAGTAAEAPSKRGRMDGGERDSLLGPRPAAATPLTTHSFADSSPLLRLLVSRPSSSVGSAGSNGGGVGVGGGASSLGSASSSSSSSPSSSIGVMGIFPSVLEWLESDFVRRQQHVKLGAYVRTAMLASGTAERGAKPARSCHDDAFDGLDANPFLLGHAGFAGDDVTFTMMSPQGGGGGGNMSCADDFSPLHAAYRSFIHSARAARDVDAEPRALPDLYHEGGRPLGMGVINAISRGGGRGGGQAPQPVGYRRGRRRIGDVDRRRMKGRGDYGGGTDDGDPHGPPEGQRRREFIEFLAAGGGGGAGGDGRRGNNGNAHHRGGGDGAPPPFFGARQRGNRHNNRRRLMYGSEGEEGEGVDVSATNAVVSSKHEGRKREDAVDGRADTVPQPSHANGGDADELLDEKEDGDYDYDAEEDVDGYRGEGNADADDSDAAGLPLHDDASGGNGRVGSPPHIDDGARSYTPQPLPYHSYSSSSSSSSLTAAVPIPMEDLMASVQQFYHTIYRSRSRDKSFPSFSGSSSSPTTTAATAIHHAAIPSLSSGGSVSYDAVVAMAQALKKTGEEGHHRHNGGGGGVGGCGDTINTDAAFDGATAKVLRYRRGGGVGGGGGRISGGGVIKEEEVVPIYTIPSPTTAWRANSMPSADGILSSARRLQRRLTSRLLGIVERYRHGVGPSGVRTVRCVGDRLLAADAGNGAHTIDTNRTLAWRRAQPTTTSSQSSPPSDRWRASPPSSSLLAQSIVAAMADAQFSADVKASVANAQRRAIHHDTDDYSDGRSIGGGDAAVLLKVVEGLMRLATDANGSGSGASGGGSAGGSGDAATLPSFTLLSSLLDDCEEGLSSSLSSSSPSLHGGGYGYGYGGRVSHPLPPLLDLSGDPSTGHTKNRLPLVSPFLARMPPSSFYEYNEQHDRHDHLDSGDDLSSSYWESVVAHNKYGYSGRGQYRGGGRGMMRGKNAAIHHHSEQRHQYDDDVASASSAASEEVLAYHARALYDFVRRSPLADVREAMRAMRGGGEEADAEGYGTDDNNDDALSDGPSLPQLPSAAGGARRRRARYAVIVDDAAILRVGFGKRVREIINHWAEGIPLRRGRGMSGGARPHRQMKRRSSNGQGASANRQDGGANADTVVPPSLLGWDVIALSHGGWSWEEGHLRPLAGGERGGRASSSPSSLASASAGAVAASSSYLPYRYGSFDDGVSCPNPFLCGMATYPRQYQRGGGVGGRGGAVNPAVATSPPLAPKGNGNTSATDAATIALPFSKDYPIMEGLSTTSSSNQRRLRRRSLASIMGIPLPSSPSLPPLPGMVEEYVGRAIIETESDDDGGVPSDLGGGGLLPSPSSPPLAYIITLRGALSILCALPSGLPMGELITAMAQEGSRQAKREGGSGAVDGGGSDDQSLPLPSLRMYWSTTRLAAEVLVQGPSSSSPPPSPSSSSSLSYALEVGGSASIAFDSRLSLLPYSYGSDGDGRGAGPYSSFSSPRTFPTLLAAYYGAYGGVVGRSVAGTGAEEKRGAGVTDLAKGAHRLGRRRVASGEGGGASDRRLMSAEQQPPLPPPPPPPPLLQGAVAGNSSSLSPLSAVAGHPILHDGGGAHSRAAAAAGVHALSLLHALYTVDQSWYSNTRRVAEECYGYYNGGSSGNRGKGRGAAVGGDGGARRRQRQRRAAERAPLVDGTAVGGSSGSGSSNATTTTDADDEAALYRRHFDSLHAAYSSLVGVAKRSSSSSSPSPLPLPPAALAARAARFRDAQRAANGHAEEARRLLYRNNQHNAAAGNINKRRGRNAEDHNILGPGDVVEGAMGWGGGGGGGGRGAGNGRRRRGNANRGDGVVAGAR